MYFSSNSNSTYTIPSNAHFIIDDIHRRLLSLSENFFLGLDNIPGYVLFNLRDSLFWPFLFLFRKSLNEGKFFFILKMSYFLLLLKTKNSFEVVNCRPITKIFETLVLISIRYNTIYDIV